MTVAVITGAAGGLGAAFARALASRGHQLVLVDIRQGALEELAHQLTREHTVAVHTIAADLTDRRAVEHVAQAVAARADLEVLVNNAGYGKKGLLFEMQPREQLAMIDIMVAATVRLCRAALPALIARRSGAVINVASVGAFKPGTDWAIYGAAKRFILHYTESLAEELRGSGVRAQALCPGFTHTGFHDASGALELKWHVPDSLWMTADEVAQASLRALDDDHPVLVPSVRHYLHLAATYSSAFRRALYATLRRIEGSRPWI